MGKKVQKKNKNNLDIETAAELTPTDVDAVDDPRREDREANGKGIGITALILSLLALFLYPFMLSIAAIILGIVGGRRGSAAGWWAVGIGAAVLLIRILIFPITAIF
jgi:hypothetical protein